MISLYALSYLIIQTFYFGKKTFYSTPRGKPLKGIFYSFGKGMLPWEKESVGKNIFVYFEGIFYHSAILSCFIFLSVKILSLQMNVIFYSILKIIISLGLLSGTGLFLRRVFSSYLRKISILDDFFANLFVNGFLLLSLITTFNPSILPFLYLYFSLLLLYIPAGKIRHCFFFFYSKILSGIYFGWRGVFGKTIELLKE